MRYFLCPLLFVLGHGVACANAHGYVRSLLVDCGKEYPGWLPFSDPYEEPVPARIVRKFPDDGPVTSLSSSSLVCNEGGQKGTKKTAEVAAGSDITFRWTSWPEEHQGPITTYMTSCEGDCSTFDPTHARWFKIDEAGFANKKWATAQLISQGNTWTSRIPRQIRSGQYLIRNEIAAFHSGSAQMYPSCAQVKVTGGGNAMPSDNEQMTIADVYRGFKKPDIWGGTITKFTVPGPPVAALARSEGKPRGCVARRRF